MISEPNIQRIFHILRLNDNFWSSFNELNRFLSPPSFVAWPHFAAFGHSYRPIFIVGRHKFCVVVFSVLFVKDAPSRPCGLQERALRFTFAILLSKWWIYEFHIYLTKLRSSNIWNSSVSSSLSSSFLCILRTRFNASSIGCTGIAEVRVRIPESWTFSGFLFTTA